MKIQINKNAISLHLVITISYSFFFFLLFFFYFLLLLLFKDKSNCKHIMCIHLTYSSQLCSENGGKHTPVNVLILIYYGLCYASKKHILIAL